MTKSVLLTRSDSANAQLKERLQQYDYELLECSLIEYELQQIDLSELEKFTDLVITSFFAASSLPSVPSKGMHVWVVGTKSAKIIGEKGYNIKFIAQSAESLKKQIPEEIYENTIYLSGNHITVNMPAPIMRRIFYKVTYRESLSQKQILRYKQGINYILIYSENCAKTLIKLLLENNLMNYLENTTYIAISSKVEKVIKHHFRNTQICQGDDLMLEYLEKQ